MLAAQLSPGADSQASLILARHLQQQADEALALVRQLQAGEPNSEDAATSEPATAAAAGAKAETGAEAAKAAILAKRRAHLPPNLATFFAEDPLHVVEGRGCQLFDEAGNAYLDCINNVGAGREGQAQPLLLLSELRVQLPRLAAHVLPPPLLPHQMLPQVSHLGHAHPAVAEAVSRQLFRLNTNSRYLSVELATYAERLQVGCAQGRGGGGQSSVQLPDGPQTVIMPRRRRRDGPPSCCRSDAQAPCPAGQPPLRQATAPDPLSVVYMLTSGSEANELAWRLARAAARRAGVAGPLHVAVMDHGGRMCACGGVVVVGGG